MAERSFGQMSLVDHLVGEAAPSNAFLEQASALLDWHAVDEVLAPVRPSTLGAPGYPALAMFKALLLQQWYALSDPALEEALGDRLSFRRFCGVPLDQKTPDHATLWRFRERLAGSGLAEVAFRCVTEQIERAGLVLKKGTLIDASLIPAAVNKPAPPEGDLPVEPDGRPGSKLVRSPLDPDAAWAKKQGRRYFGYKAHVALDMESRIVRRATLTPANVNETSCADGLICGDERAVYADKAYDSKARRAALKARGIRNRIMRRWHLEVASAKLLGAEAQCASGQTPSSNRTALRPAQECLPLLSRTLSRPPPQRRRPATGRHRDEPEKVGAACSDRLTDQTTQCHPHVPLRKPG